MAIVLKFITGFHSKTYDGEGTLVSMRVILISCSTQRFGCKYKTTCCETLHNDNKPVMFEDDRPAHSSMLTRKGKV